MFIQEYLVHFYHFIVYTKKKISNQKSQSINVLNLKMSSIFLSASLLI